VSIANSEASIGGPARRAGRRIRESNLKILNNPTLVEDAESLTDLLVNMLHLAKQYDWHFEDCLGLAREYYLQEDRPRVVKGEMRLDRQIMTVARTVADYFNVEISSVLKADRRERFAWPRQVAMMLSFELIAGTDYESIGLTFRKSRTAVHHAVARVRSICETEKIRALDVSLLRERVTSVLEASATGSAIEEAS
jgi:hypothetical protein